MRLRSFEAQNSNFRQELRLRYELWIENAQMSFHQLIMYGESQPSNGTVRRVEPPDGITSFIVAYGSEPDHGLQICLVRLFLQSFTLKGILCSIYSR